MKNITIRVFQLSLVFSEFIGIIFSDYIPPQARVEPLTPRGIRLSIPDEEGISLVAFHVKFNEDFEGLEAGTIARDIVRVKKGRWSYEDRTTHLKFGDTVYYWIHVVYNRLGYNSFQQHEVTDFYNYDGTKATSRKPEDQVEGSDCLASQTKVLELSSGILKNVCTGQLLLDEEFENLDQSKWKVAEKIAKGPDYPFSAFRNDKKNVDVDKGKLHLIPTLVEREFGRDFIRHGNLTFEKCTGNVGTSDCRQKAIGRYILPPTLSGSIDTSHSLVFLHGKIQIRAKLPRGDWIYPIIAMERFQDSPTACPQFRIASSAGNTVLTLPGGADGSGHILTAGPSKTTPGDTSVNQNPQRYAVNLWSDEYHIYELEWSKDRMKFRVDNIEYGTLATKPPFNQPMFLRLAVAVGGHTEFPDNSMTTSYSKPWKNVGAQAPFDFYNTTELWSGTWTDDVKNLKIDYVKIWAL